MLGFREFRVLVLFRGFRVSGAQSLGLGGLGV